MRARADFHTPGNATDDTSPEAYFREIVLHELLTAQEEVALAQHRDAGRAATAQLTASTTTLSEQECSRLEQLVDMGCQAQRRLIECNLRLVVSVARNYLGRGLALLDLVQEGNLGLQIGIDKFDWRRGFRVSTYVHWWIRQSVMRALNRHSRAVRLPTHVVAFLTDAKRAEGALTAELGRQPTDDELAQTLRVNVVQLSAARRMARSPLPLDSPTRIGGDDQRTLGESLPDEAAEQAGSRAAESADLSARLQRVLTELTPREREVLQLRFGLDGLTERTLLEVGIELGLSRERVRQIEATALSRLRSMPGVRRGLAEYIYDVARDAA
ncbi:MAG TPA: sigma-70 family RNA polymerase sigma factor [Chloroflexota bacterium]|jgi:RNA polymerase primary sigma factor